MEPGPTTMANPNAWTTTPTPQSPAGHPPTNDSADLAALVVGPVPLDSGTEPEPAGRVRAFLMTRPEVRPILVLIRPRGSGEPLFVTGLPPCAAPLPDCATEVPATGATTVY